MTKCNIFNIYIKLCVIFEKLEGFKMSIVVKNAQSLLEKFEKSLEVWAERFF